MKPSSLPSPSLFSLPTETLYTCPRCQRTGFYAKGLVSHVCRGASFLDKRRRLTPGGFAQAKIAGTSAIRGARP